MTQDNIAYTLKLQGDNKANMPMAIPGASAPPADFSLLKSMICVSTYNKILQETLSKNGESATGNTMYTAYTIAQDTTHLYFGDQAAGNARIQPGYTGPNTAGMECGAVVIVAPDCPVADKHNPNSKCGDEASREQIYTLANWNMAQGLQGIAKEISTNLDNDTNWENYYSSVFHNSELYINYLVGYQDFLFYNKKDELKSGEAFKQYKKYGWILAGNYYTILSAFKERVNFMTRQLVPPTSVNWLEVDGTSTMPVAKPGDPYDLAYTAEIDFWTSLESHVNSEPKEGPDYGEYIATYGQGVGKKAENISGSGNKIGPVNMDKLLATISGKSGTNNLKGHGGNKKKRGKGVVKGNASMATVSAVQNYIQYLTGANSRTGDFRVAHDPILRASEYGKSLTSAAIPMMVTATILSMLAAAAHVCDALVPVGSLADATIKFVSWGLIALGMFMYTQGAILGVFIPLIPYVTFFIGVVGWLLQVVEAIAAAPLVAIGLIFPETRDEIWGRAQPAVMMILALFLRPPLMLVGFAAAMIVLWCLTELLNIGFLTLTAVTFRIEDMFGFVTIMMAYTAMFTVVVTRSYELINVVPNKVLNWIGGPGMEIQGAQEAIGAAKGGVQEGSQAVASGQKGASETFGGEFEKAEKGGQPEEGNIAKRKKTEDAKLGPPPTTGGAS
jgi:conjugal transfer/type IV secretion protein DotA/TraY